MPPGVVTPPPAPLQLPLVVQIEYVPAVRAGKLSVTLAVGVTKPMVVVNDPFLAVMILVLVPCSVKPCEAAPSVKLLLGVIVLSAVVLVMSLLAPVTAELRFDRAPAAVMAPVPPLAILKAVDKVRPLKVGDDEVAMF